MHIDLKESGGGSHNLPEYIFPNLRAHINFTVTAVNVVGDGEITSMVYEACKQPDGGNSTHCMFSLLVKGWGGESYSYSDELGLAGSPRKARKIF